MRPLDSATVILLRESPELEVLLVRRHKKSGFMGGAFVFPGGKLDEVDKRFASQLRRPAWREDFDQTPGVALSEDAIVGLGVCALRELFEEAGVLLAEPLTEDLMAGRSAVHADASRFASLLAAEGSALRIDQLVYFAHWITPSLEPRRFDARFFLARLPAGQLASVDEHETTEHRWLTPQAALAAHADGEIFLPPPTQCSLEEIAQAESFEAATRIAQSRAVEPILPKLAPSEDGILIVLPWDEAYEGLEGESVETTSPHPMARGASRIELRPGILKTKTG